MVARWWLLVTGSTMVTLFLDRSIRRTGGCPWLSDSDGFTLSTTFTCSPKEMETESWWNLDTVQNKISVQLKNTVWKNNSKNSCHEIAKSMSLISNYYLPKNAVSISFSCALCLLYELYALLFVGNYQISEEGWTYPLQHQHQPILTPSSSDMGALSEKPSHSIIGGYTDSSVLKSQSRI